MEENAILTSTEEVITFRRLNNAASTEVVTPAPSSTRKVTDKKGFILMFGLFVPFLVFSVVYFFQMKSDIRRIFFPVDHCGNFCGLDNKNNYLLGIYCSGIDLRHKPYLVLNECNETCSYNISMGSYTCQESEIFFKKIYNSRHTVIERQIENGNVIKDLFNSQRTPGWKFFVSTLITFGICVFSSFVSCPIRICLWPSYFIVFFINFYFAIVLFPLEDFQCAIFFFTYMLVLMVVLLSFLLYREMFNALYYETAKIFRSIPLLLLFTLIVTIIQFLLGGFVILFIMRAMSPSELLAVSPKDFIYKNITGPLILWVVAVVLAVNWAIHFISGVHCMVIAGSVTSWYFRESTGGRSYVSINFCRVMKYHVGTIVYWAVFQPWIDMLKYCTDRMSNACENPYSIQQCLGRMTIHFEYFSKHSLIETAIHGQPLLRSGKRAVGLMLRIEGLLTGKLTVNLIWLMPQFGIFVVTALISRLMFLDTDHIWIPLSICLVANLAIILVFFETSKVIANSSLLCFLEFRAINGDARPHHDLTNIKIFIDKCVDASIKNLNLIRYCQKNGCTDV